MTVTDTRLPDAAIALTQTQSRVAASGSTSTSGHLCRDSQTATAAGGSNFPDASVAAHSHHLPASGSRLARADQPEGYFHQTPVGACTPASDATNSDSTSQVRDVASEPNFDSSHSPNDNQEFLADVESTSTGLTATCSSMPNSATRRPGGFLRDPVIGILAEVVDDFEKVRIANANRVRILTHTGVDTDGEERGFGLGETHPEVRKLILTVDAMKAAEHDAILNLQRALRKHPLAASQKRHKGLGEKQLARLLASIGDPYWNDLHQRPRTVSELWAYCGFHVLHPGGQAAPDTHNNGAAGVAPKRMRGQRSNWSEDARKRTWVIASAMPKFAGGTYETVYRDARVKYAEVVHPADCVRCGPAGKPAIAGSPLSDGHKHARAIRITAKAILRDLWIESRNIYEARNQ